MRRVEPSRLGRGMLRAPPATVALPYFFFTSVKNNIVGGGNLTQTGNSTTGWAITCASPGGMGADDAEGGGSSIYLPAGVNGSFYFELGTSGPNWPGVFVATDANYHYDDDPVGDPIVVIRNNNDSAFYQYRAGVYVNPLFSTPANGDWVRFDRTGGTNLNVAVSHNTGSSWSTVVNYTDVPGNLWGGAMLSGNAGTEITRMWCVGGTAYP